MRRATVAYETIQIDDDGKMRYSCCTDYGYFTPAHWHDSIEILYILDGESIVQIDQMSYTLPKNAFIIIDSNVIHTTACRIYSHFLLIQIPYPFLREHIPDINYIHFQNVCSTAGQPLSGQAVRAAQTADPAALEAIRGLLRQLAELWHTKPEAYRLKYYSYIFDLLYLMMTHFRIDITQTEYRQTEKYMERLTAVIDYVQAHYTEPVSLQATAEHLALNPSYFARFFRKYMGMTFLEYVNTIRLHAIYEDIISTDLPVQTILEKNGFTNYKLFMRMFRQTYGCTPGQKRREIETVGRIAEIGRNPERS